MKRRKKDLQTVLGSRLQKNGQNLPETGEQWLQIHDGVLALSDENGKIGEEGINMITDLINQILVDNVIPVKWKFRTFVS